MAGNNLTNYNPCVIIYIRGMISLKYIGEVKANDRNN